MVQLRRVVRAGAVLAVLALLALLIWHATTRHRGGELVAAVQHKRLPADSRDVRAVDAAILGSWPSQRSPYEALIAPGSNAGLARSRTAVMRGT